MDASTGSYHTEVDFPFVVDPDESLYFNFPFTVYTSTTGILTFKFTSNLHDDELHILNRQSIKVKILSGGPDGDDTGLPVVATDVTWDWNAAGDEATIIGTQAYSLGAGEHTIQVELYGQNVKLAATLNYTDTVVTTGDNPAAGLRIASIENYDFDNTLLTKKVYGYKNPATNKTSGQRTSDLGFNFISDTFKSFDPTYCPQTEGSAMLPRIDYTSTYSISSDSKYGVDGASVTYEYVQESSVDSLGVKLGLTEYKFSTGTDWYPHPSIIIPTPWKRGKLLEKTDYKIISSNRYPVRKEVNTYVEDNSKIVNVEGFKMRRLSNVPLSESQNPTVPPYQLLPECAMPSTVNFMVVFHKYNMVVPWEYLKKTEVTDYFYDSPTNISNTMLTSTQFNYNNPVHLQLSSRVTTTSRNETFETKYYYPGDASVQNEPQISNLISRNMISTPVKTENYLKGQKISEQKTIYNSWPSISGLPHILPEIIQAAKGDNATLENRIITEERDPAGNPTEVRLGNGLSVCYIWGYSDTHPVAKIENTSYASIDQDLINEIKEKSTYGTEEELIDKLNALRLSLPGKMITTYTFRPLIGIHTITDPRGYKMTYEIDNLGRLQYVRDSEGKILTENFYHYKD